MLATIATAPAPRTACVLSWWGLNQPCCQVSTYPPALVVGGGGHDIEQHQPEHQVDEHHRKAPDPMHRELGAGDTHGDEMLSHVPPQQRHDAQSIPSQARVQIDWSSVQGDAGARNVAHGLHDFEAQTSQAYAEMVAQRSTALEQHRTGAGHQPQLR